jgi:hypothetical protein
MTEGRGDPDAGPTGLIPALIVDIGYLTLMPRGIFSLRNCRFEEARPKRKRTVRYCRYDFDDGTVGYLEILAKD